MKAAATLPIFNHKKLLAHKKRVTRQAINNCEFFQHSINEIIINLGHLEYNFTNILILNCHNHSLSSMIEAQYSNARIVTYDIIDENNVFIKEREKFDLIIFILGLHWINDVVSFLKQIRCLLKQNAIFVGNFISGDSLTNLRRKLIDAESLSKHFHSPHISPFIEFSHVTSLLQQSGFHETVAAYEKITLEYNGPLALMRTLQDIGESNILIKAANYAISKKMFEILREDNDPFYDHINLTSFIAAEFKNTIKLKKHD